MLCFGAFDIGNAEKYLIVSVLAALVFVLPPTSSKYLSIKIRSKKNQQQQKQTNTEKSNNKNFWFDDTKWSKEYEDISDTSFC